MVRNTEWPQVALLILHALVRRHAVNMPPRFEQICRFCPSRPLEVVTTDRVWRHHNHDGMNFCEAESRRRTSSVDIILRPSRLYNRPSIESRSWPLKLDTNTSFSIDLPMVRCESPIAIWECEGDCRNKYPQTTEAAHVVSIYSSRHEFPCWGRLLPLPF
jgi:hypothetical protein